MDTVIVGIISKQKLVRRALTLLIFSLGLSGLSLGVDADTVVDASQQILAHRPHILLIDCSQSTSSLDCIRKVLDLSPRTKCLLLSDEREEKFAIQAARNGAWGVVSKDMDAQVLKSAMEKLVAGQMCFSEQVLTSTIRSLVRREPSEVSAFDNLTSRETQILALLGIGLSNKEIARRLFLSPSTVKGYLENVYEKLGVHTRTEAALAWTNKSALHAGLLQ